MRNYKIEADARVEFIRQTLKNSRTSAIVFGNSGGKDCALAGILCKMACDNTLSVMMPCESKQNFLGDMEDAIALAGKFNIENITVDLTKAKLDIIDVISEVSDAAKANIAPRLRMTTLYTIAQTRNALVCGTGNASERYMGYFTKWGDGAFDFNPIADLTVTEIYEFLEYFGAPKSIITKAPSAGLFEGQTDEKEMGITYKEIDNFILNGIKSENYDKIESTHKKTEHKRILPVLYSKKGSF